jgi:hypothetical protein
MSTEQRKTDAQGQAMPRRVPAWMYVAALAGVVIGAVAFGLAATAAGPTPAWRALLINFLFWSSVAQGAFMWTVAFHLARTTWSAPVSRIGQSAVGFMGLSVLLFIGLFLGRRFYLPWLPMDLGDRSVWLNVPFVFLRDGGGLLVLFVLAAAFVRARQRADSVSGAVERDAPQGELHRSDHRLSVLGVSLALVYAVVATPIAFDLVMSLMPTWFSTLFGWYYLVGALYAGMAALIVAVVLLRQWLGITVGPQQFQDLGNLLLAFAMLMTYFIFSQALVIWYENLPPETAFAIPRLHMQPWGTLSWVALWVCCLGPFFLLLVREMKENPRTLLAVSVLVLSAMWFERYLLVTPSLAPAAPGSPVLVLLIGAGFLGLLVLTAAPLLARLPMSGPLDARLLREREAWQ